LVEQLLRKETVEGSIPFNGTTSNSLQLRGLFFCPAGLPNKHKVLREGACVVGPALHPAERVRFSAPRRSLFSVNALVVIGPECTRIFSMPSRLPISAMLPTASLAPLDAFNLIN
jgi:hypothetical protein